MIVAGTGHRPEKLDEYLSPRDLVRFARHVLAQREPSRVISGMAVGWDTALAQAACDMNVPFVAAVPFKGQEERWPAHAQTQYHLLLERASEVATVCEGGYEPWKFQRRNEWMTDRCELLLALWNGTPGGTANCLRYADKIGRRVDNVWDEFEAWLQKNVD